MIPIARLGESPYYVRNPNPFVPWYLVSSSAGTRFDGLEFGGVRPVCVEMRVTTMDLCEVAGTRADGVITAWEDGQGGFFVHGCCHRSL